MRLTRLAPPIALLVVLVCASPAVAADYSVEVTSPFSFEPAARQIAVGDTVTWNFTEEGHTTTSAGGQPDSWHSTEEGTTPVGTAYPHTFNTPGRYQYFCTPHRSFMKGVIEVGTDAVGDSVDNFKAKRSGRSVKVSFLLNEAATVTYKLTGATRRTVKRGRLAAGRHSFTVRRLRLGTHRGVLTVVDDFDKKITPRNFFVVR
jgi:plastocyanin